MSECGEHERSLHTRSLTIVIRTGELPLSIGRLKAKGCEVNLDGNQGFTIPSNMGELGDDIVELDLSECSLQGSCITR